MQKMNSRDYERHLTGENFDKCIETVVGVLKSAPTLKDGQRQVYNAIGAFDIETSHVSDTITESFCYMWQFSIGENDTVIFGRTVDEFIRFLQMVNLFCKETVVIYVHNLAFEFQFLRSYMDIKPDDIFFVDNRKPAYFTWMNYEFRDSLLLTNMSLDQFTHKYKARHVKQDGEEFNYQEIRLPSTPLTDEQWYYGACDVLGLKEALTTLFASEGDNIVTVPMSSTGYVRRDVKNAMTASGEISKVKNKGGDVKVFDMLRQAFRGGNTHANRYYTGKILENVDSADRSSSYPDVLINRKYPYEFRPMDKPTIHHILYTIDHKRYAVLMRVKFDNIELRNPLNGFPYISVSKCQRVLHSVEDNGRVLYAEYLETVVTDIDFRIIRDHYTCDSFICEDVYISKYEWLPEAFREEVREYYRKKTELKNVDGFEIYYMKSKNKLNALFGMCCTNNIKAEIEYRPGEEEPFHVGNLTDDEKAKMLKKQAMNQFLLYAWGVWCTAWAREALQWGLDIAGEKAVYCDTDSVKYLADDGISKRMQELSERLREDSDTNGAYAIDPKGETHYMGVYEDDGHYDKFSTLGAKKYAYENKKGFHITIAGVPKDEGAEEMKCIENFKPMFKFSHTGKKVRRYNDHVEPNFYNVTDIFGNTEKVEVRTNIDLRETTYILDVTPEYRKIFSMCQDIMEEKPVDRQYQSLRYGFNLGLE